MDPQREDTEAYTHKPDTNPKGPLAQREEEILAFWNEEKIFEQSLAKPSPKGEYVFYDGPPFANGLPHYGHIVPSSIKDVIPRYRTMQGYHVTRRWGWDCHGLPVENLVEKELGFKTKRDIEQFGIAKFNEAARKSIMKDVADWKRIIPRMGRWADMEHDYRTMDASYTESVWWAFKNLHDRGLIYEGFKAMHMCPRCGTTLANFEVAMGYKDIDDYAVTVKLPLVDEPGTSLLIWTTTPWTLPGNSAAAVNTKIDYVKVRYKDELYITAKARVETVFGDSAEIVAEVEGKSLLGKKYTPPFSYFKDTIHKHKTHAWRVYNAPYVTAEDGTGIVHLAPAFGEEDLLLAQEEKIPIIQHVTDEGKFIVTVADFAHLPVKPKGHHMDTDAHIIEYLEAHGLLFAKEKIRHSYPHCWRCDTPLLNWAANSWFVKVSAIKNKILAQNAKVHWVPEHVGSKRFQKGIESAPDWAISRSRYWGAPLPVWRHSKSKEVKVIGSVEELLSLVRRSGNRYVLMRHGEAQSNIDARADGSGDPKNHVTEKGRKKVKETAEALKRSGAIDLIVTSPLPRAKETAQLVQETFGLPDSAVMVDERLSEVHFGSFDQGSIDAYKHSFASYAERLQKAPLGGETYLTVRQRVGEFLFELEQRYSGKNILIITHGGPGYLLYSVANRYSLAHTAQRNDDEDFLSHGEARELPFTLFPHNQDFELDLHRPYIDEIPLGNSLTGEWKRVSDVFDCWFESGAMPFASNHYPFEKEVFDPKRGLGFSAKGYPAHFIAESLDQTRGWFYSLIVLGTALFGKSPYKNVITNGLVLAEDGQKMSKRLKNYPDLMGLIDQFGVDAIRYYLLSSSIIRGEDLRFTARGVEEVAKKLLMRLDNVRAFYALYNDDTLRSATSTHVLDRWILSRLGELVRAATEGFETYQLDVALRPIGAFIDDLSTWYVRRSRGRFKQEGEDKRNSLATLRYVLYVLSHVIAPSMPFFAEYLFRSVREKNDTTSVHLAAWPDAHAIDATLLTDMEHVRTLSSKGLELRERAGIKIRQPLSSLTAKSLPEEPALRRIIGEEVNVKDVLLDPSLQEEVRLDTVLTESLQQEGIYRDVVRIVQDFRKKEGLTISDRPSVVIATNKEGKQFIESVQKALIEETGLSELLLMDGGEAHKDVSFPIHLERN